MKTESIFETHWCFFVWFCHKGRTMASLSYFLCFTSVYWLGTIKSLSIRKGRRRGQDMLVKSFKCLFISKHRRAECVLMFCRTDESHVFSSQWLVAWQGSNLYLLGPCLWLYWLGLCSFDFVLFSWNVSIEPRDSCMQGKQIYQLNV